MMPVSRAVVRRPGRIMAQAKRAGMVVLLQMLRRGETDLPGVYSRTLKIWRDTWAESQRLRKIKDIDYFIPICRAERYLRKNHHNMIFNTTALYGNTEPKRVYSWDEGPIGPMNQLLNIAGARLRFLGMTRYPFPTPIKMPYYYTLRDGSTKSEIGYGYRGSARSTKVILAHPALQPLDFVDMIRAPLNELCRQCFIYSVPGKNAAHHMNYLILKLKPFLDHIYTREKTGSGKKVGTNRFVEQIDGILDDALTRMQSGHGTRSTRVQRVTQGLVDEEWSSRSRLTLDDIHPNNLPSEQQDHLKNLIKKEIVTQTDFRQLASKVLTAAAGRGTQIHRRVSWGLPSPASEVASVLGGDFYARTNDGYNLCADVPVWSGKGKADLVLYVRQSLVPEVIGEEPVQAAWRPVMVLDIKTKASFDCGFVGRQVTDTSKVVIESSSRKRDVRQIEWQAALDNTPTHSELRQLDSYARGITANYQRLTKTDSQASSVLVQGIVVVDESESISKIRSHLRSLVISVYEEIQEYVLSLATKKLNTKGTNLLEESIKTKRIGYELTGSKTQCPRAAIVVLPFEIPKGTSPAEALPSPNELPAFHSTEVFADRMNDNRHFILYVSARNQGAGESASWIARYWHGMNYARRIFTRHNHRKVMWLDLAGEFSSPTIRRAFLKRSALQGIQSSTESKQKRYLREFSRHVKFLNLSSSVMGALFNGEDFPTAAQIKKLTRGYDLVILSGLDTIRGAISSEHHGLLDVLVVHIAEGTKKRNSTLIWFDTTIPSNDTSEIYKQNRCKLIAYDSPLRTHIDEIVLNHHLPPTSGISESPFSDDIRHIIRLTPSGYDDLGFTEVPPLGNWWKRFRSEAKPDDISSKTYSLGIGGSLAHSDFNWLSSDMLHDILSSTRMGKSCILNAPSANSALDEKLLLSKLTLKTPSQSYKGVLSRISLSNDLCSPAIREAISRKEGVQFEPLTSVNTKRKYWTARLHLTPRKLSFLPADESRLNLHSISLQNVARVELERILNAIAVLGRTESTDSLSVKEFLRLLVRRFNELQLTTGKSDTLMVEGLSEFFRKNEFTQSVWWGLSYYRSSLFDWNIPPIARGTLKAILQKNPSALHHIGNYFTMLISFLQDSRGTAFTLSELYFLWDCIRPWILMQLGAVQSKTDLPKSRFDMRKVFESLKTRVKVWNTTPLPFIPSFNSIRYGLMWDSIHPMDRERTDDHVYRWYIFERAPYSKELIAGCMRIKGHQVDHRAIIPLDEQAEYARKCLSSDLTRPILIGNASEVTILYEPDDAEYRDVDKLDHSTIDWRAVGQMRYGTRHIGALARLRWLSTSYYASFPIPISENLPRRNSSVFRNMVRHLKKISTDLSNVTRVTCKIIGDANQGHVIFEDEEHNQMGQLGYENHSKASEILRAPYDLGQPLILGQSLLTWNPLVDIEYSLLAERIKKEVIRGIV
ncbi:MAG: hypothetical protein ACFFER_12570 [Candidatus Thorarchaeota archaeon]